MAQFIPSLDDIRNLTVKPQEGELYLLEFLNRVLDDTFEVYFNPYMNGDRPDVIIMKEGQGVMIIEVKDWILDSYELDEKKNWKVKNHKDEFTIKSPISQVLKYKENLFDLHIKILLDQKIGDIRKFNTVTCAVYFHNASQKKIEDLLVNPFNNDRKYQDFLKYNIDLIGRDTLNNDSFRKILKTSPLISNKFAPFFTDDIYKSIKRFISPTIHMKEEGKSMNYSDQQGKIIYDTTRKQIRVKGVVGSGKTTVLAARAVNLYKRTRGEILILTFNITLRNFIQDKIRNIREDFPLNNFIILNYHFFIKAELNNIGISIEIPDNFEIFTTEKKSEYFEKRYFSNIRLFEYLKELDLIKKYDVILIDEVQDYKRPWLDIIKNYFLTEGGYYMLLGDVKQNIYMTPTENKDVSVNISGRGDELKNCFRSDFRIKDLAIEFQKEFYKDKYEIDDFNKNEIDNSNTNSLGLSFTKQGTVNYIYLTGEINTNNNSIKALYTIIHENAINKVIQMTLQY
jgi:nuclease-related domain protein